MSKGHIVVIDDDPLIRMLVEEYLKVLGYTVSAFSKGSEGLAAINATPPDLVVLDLQMPEMNGLEVLAAIRGEAGLAKVPVLMLSANAHDASGFGDAVKADGYLEKPFQMQTFLQAVQTTRRE